MKYPHHLLQSNEWAEFREKWGTKVIKTGNAQFTVHSIPRTSLNIGYMARVYPEEIQWEELRRKAAEDKCVFIKIEPNSESFSPPKNLKIIKGERIFAYATYLIDLTKNEEELLSLMHPKTRYNIKVAKRKGVKVKIGHTNEMLDEFLTLYHDTNKRHNVFSHPDSYYRLIFDVFRKKDKVEIVTGYFEGIPLASMMVFVHEGTLFYPYGGSTTLHKETMPFYLVMWETILYGKKKGCKTFDMWNCLPPEIEKPTHPWYGFHRFKKGFGGQLVRFPGAYDVIFMPKIYPFVIALDKLRWAALRSGKVLKKLINL